MANHERESLCKRLRELERAVERQLESLQELQTVLRERAAYIDAKFAHAEEVIRSIGRRENKREAGSSQA